MVDGVISNPAYVFLLRNAKDAAGDAITVCKKQGPFEIANISFARNLFSMRWPSGDYRVNFKFYDDIDDNIYNLTYYSSVYG